MTHGLWHSVAGLQAQQLRQDLISNNLANADTAGFKPDHVTFRERLAARLEGDAPGEDTIPTHDVLDRLTGGLATQTTFTDFRAGPIVSSRNPLDTVIDGEGFLAVRTRDGVRYTRDARLSIGPEGALVTVSGGHTVLDRGGQPIVVDTSTHAAIAIDDAGNVRQGSEELGQLNITTFTDQGKLAKAGANLFSAAEARVKSTEGRIHAGGYEASGVVAVTELVRMIEAGRAFGVNAQLISIQDETLARAVNDVGRIV